MGVRLSTDRSLRVTSGRISRRGVGACVAASVCWLAPIAAGQGATPVDQGFDDVGPLSSSLRRVEEGLRQSDDFGRLYRLPGGEDGFFRRQGGVVAIFERSDYVATRGGEAVPVIPAGTVFHIGPVRGIDFALPGRREDHFSPNLLSSRVSLTARGAAPGGAGSTAMARPLAPTALAAPQNRERYDAAPIIVQARPERERWAGEAARGERIASHLDRAFRAGKAGSLGP